MADQQVPRYVAAYDHTHMGSVRVQRKVPRLGVCQQ